MENTSTQRIGAGVTLLFAPDRRPDALAIQKALDACQVQASIVHDDTAAGALDVTVNGLVFEVDGLEPATAHTGPLPDMRYGLAETDPASSLDGIRIYPGHALSGGITMGPVTRALLAISAELAVMLSAEAVHWHSAETLIEARQYSRLVLAWLAGGSFPAPGLVALLKLADGSIVSRGLMHFVDQELILRGGTHGVDTRDAAQVIDWLVRHGPPAAFTRCHIQGTEWNVEPAQEARQIIVWRSEEGLLAKTPMRQHRRS
jgi:hypothetical protein